jgi:hypothetical protein
MTTQLVTTQLAQPPTFDLDLFDGERAIGWLTPHAVGFLGFANEAEAMHAAWVAHRTLARRLAHRDGRRPVPIDVEPLALTRDDGVHAGGRRIATLMRPGAERGTGAETFGFEIAFPARLDEVSARAKSMHIYRTLRRSGIRWSMWRPDRPEREAAEAASTVAADEPLLRATPAPILSWSILVTAVSSLGLMTLALLSSERAAPAFAGVGLVGLIALRLYAMRAGWPPRSRPRRA